jgi:hypothetical protein
MSKTVAVDADRLKVLLEQNAEMKELITEAYRAWSKISRILNLGEGRNFMLKVPKIMHQVNRNPEMFSNLVKQDFEERLKKFVNETT